MYTCRHKLKHVSEPYIYIYKLYIYFTLYIYICITFFHCIWKQSCYISIFICLSIRLLYSLWRTLFIAQFPAPELRSCGILKQKACNFLTDFVPPIIHVYFLTEQNTHYLYIYVLNSDHDDVFCVHSSTFFFDTLIHSQ